MNELVIQGKITVCGIEVPRIAGGFGEDKPVMLAKTIAELHGREPRAVNQAINMNRERFRDGIDVIDAKGTELTINLIDSQIITQDAVNASKNIYVLSRIGYSKLLKIFEDDLAWDRYEQILGEYFEVKEHTPLQNLSPQLQVLINLELRQKQLETAFTQTKEEIQSIRDVVSLNPNSWREETTKLITKMAQRLGGNEHIRDLRTESYTLLDLRMGVDVKTRLTNKRRRMMEEGVCKSKRDKLNPLDVIADDKKLIEGYVAIIKDMAVKYGV